MTPVEKDGIPINGWSDKRWASAPVTSAESSAFSTPARLGTGVPKSLKDDH